MPSSSQPTLPLFDEVDEAGVPSLPDGFIYRPDFIPVEEERALRAGIERLEFGEVRMHGVAARRRVVQLGWQYRFEGGSLSEGRVVPSFLLAVRGRVAAALGREPGELSEILLTEYRPGATIGWHRDAPPFGVVAGISLVSPCRFRFRRRDGDGWLRAELTLAPRSLYVLDGPARAAWQHSIPAVGSLRYSITFRTLRPSARARSGLERAIAGTAENSNPKTRRGN